MRDFSTLFKKLHQLLFIPLCQDVFYDLATDIEICYVNLFNRFDQETYSRWIKEFNDYRKSIDPDTQEAREIKFD